MFYQMVDLEKSDNTVLMNLESKPCNRPEKRYGKNIPDHNSNKMKQLSPFLFFGIILLAGCGKVYYSPDAVSRAGTHKVIAIAPPKITIKSYKETDPEALLKQQKVESENFQKEMYDWFIRRKMQDKILVEVQDIETTNTRLHRAGYFDDNPLTPADVANLLRVDGLVFSSFSLSKPLSEGAAIALGVIFGVWGPTNEIGASISIQDRNTEKMIWNYSRTISGDTFTSPARIIDEIMREASNKLPYKK
jgi:hypothetical protein